MSIAIFVALGAAGVPGFTAFAGKSSKPARPASSQPKAQSQPVNAPAAQQPKSKVRQVNFAVSREDAVLIARIMDRCEAAGITTAQARFTHQMDLTACHANGCPLRLQDMLEWERDFDIAHDVAGLNQHLDRTTGKLLNFFVPRFAA